MKMKILILCTGNSCKSQMAEGYLKSIDSELEVYSAGTNPVSTVSEKAIQVMNDIKIDISNNKTKDVKQFLLDRFDYVITVSDSARNAIPVFTGDVKYKLHIGFDDPESTKGTEREIMDSHRKIRDEIIYQFKNFYISTKNHEIHKAVS